MCRCTPLRSSFVFQFYFFVTAFHSSKPSFLSSNVFTLLLSCFALIFHFIARSVRIKSHFLQSLMFILIYHNFIRKTTMPSTSTSTTMSNSKTTGAAVVVIINSHTIFRTLRLQFTLRLDVLGVISVCISIIDAIIQIPKRNASNTTVYVHAYVCVSINTLPFV